MDQSWLETGLYFLNDRACLDSKNFSVIHTSQYPISNTYILYIYNRFISLDMFRTHGGNNLSPLAQVMMQGKTTETPPAIAEATRPSMPGGRSQPYQNKFPRASPKLAIEKPES